MTSPGALITRPREDSQALAEALRQKGYRPLIEPMLTIRFRQGPIPDRDGVQGILLTSANGARALAARLDDQLAAWRDLPVWAVGDASADEARRLGFSTIASAGGDVAGLAALVAGKVNPADGRLLHVAAGHLAGDLGGLLAAWGITVDKAVLYDAEPVAALSEDVARQLGNGDLAVALFFSPRTAATFVRLARHIAVGAVKALALSPAVAESLRPLPWQNISIAERPQLSSLLALLDGE